MEINFNEPKHVYFIGIGGISMSGLASILLKEGFTVSGSDAKESDLTRKLEKEGANIYYGQEVSHLSGCEDLVVYTAAIKEDNPEFIKMRELNLPSLTRADFLGLLMKNYKTPIAVSGTHGKTTTSTMISEIFLKGNYDPTITVGGVLNSIGQNIKVGGPDYFIFEACEYTNSFLSFFPKISVILNIEEDHLDFFKDINDIRASFKRFAEILPSDGLLVINGEIPNISEIVKDIKCPYLTYGFDESNAIYADNISFDELAHGSFTCHLDLDGEKESFDVTLGVTGRHNISNALSAILVSRYLGVPVDAIKEALKECTGSKRRFEKKGVVNGITIIDDYAHHPTEIKASLTAAKNYPHNKLYVVFQPHTYTRTKAFLPEFAEALSIADKVILTDVYAAREKDVYGCNTSNLYELMKEKNCDVCYIKDFKEIEKYVLSNCTTGDLLITMGAGDVVNIADSLVSK
ncbi:MAG: UDP-N-acetylmuramate--L-alanine ligase [Lachnospiraceae bacterium]|nr:UDP-N-acetylmuramate--L-alanine ligase [Lachnospiraceae bacterium]